MSKKVDTWMPLIVDKYLGDTTDLTTEQHGAYLLLLMALWKKDGVLPNSDERLASITRLPASRWRQHKAVLMEFFTPTEDGTGLTQKRLSLELERSKSIANAKSKAGAEGAAKRWQKHGTANGTANGKDDGTAIADESQTASQTGTPIPIPSSSLRSEESLPPTAVVGKPSASPPSCPTEELVHLYHEHLPMLPRVEVLNDSRRRALSARWREVVTDGDIRKSTDIRAAGIEWFAWFFGHCAKSRFLTGKAKDWRADLDFLLTPTKFARAVEGAYHKDAA